MSQPQSEILESARRLRIALARWDNEGGHLLSVSSGESGGSGDGVPPLTNAELVQLQIRVIALENLIVALLADASDLQLERVRDIAASISPRPGVEHHLTMHAVGQMEHLAQRSLRL